MTARPTAEVPHRIGLYLAVVQFLFALTWTIYVIFLPALAAQVGVPKQAVMLILLADQLIFVVMDFSLGVAADRVARQAMRLGQAIVAMTVVSCIALLLLPWVAPQGTAWLFLALTAVWAVTSSALRAPPLALLGKYASRPAVPWLSSLTLLGLGVASAIAPYLTLQLRGLDPRWPFALSTAALVTATLGIVHVERGLRARAVQASPAAEPLRGPQAKGVPWFVGAIALLATGSQIHQFLNSAPLYLRLAAPAQLPYLMPVFWVGFNLALLPAGLATRRYGGLAVMAFGGAVAASAAWLALHADTLARLVALQFAAGGAWGSVLASAVAGALAIGHFGSEGRATGALFSMLSLAAAARIAIVAGELHRHAPYAAWLPWAPVVAWAMGCAVLLWLRRREVASSGRSRAAA